MVNPIRFSGMASGIDTETIVKDLMKVRKAPLNKLLQKKQLDEWKRDSYREMNTLLLDFRKETLTMKLQSTFLKKTGTSENDLAVGAKVNGVPTQSTYSVKVNRLATAGTPASAKFTNSLADGSTEIGGSSFTITLGTGASQKTVTIDPTDTITGALKKINDVSSTTGITAAYMASDKSITFTSSTVGSTGRVDIAVSGANNLGITNHSPVGAAVNLTTTPLDTSSFNSFTIEYGSPATSKTITLPTGKIFDGSGAGKNLSDLATEIQNQINLDAALRDTVKLRVQSVGDKLVFSADQAVTLKDAASQNMLDKLGFANNTAIAAGAMGTDVQAGEVVINGVTHSITSNTFTYDGMEFTAKQVTATAINVNVKTDENAIFEAVKNYVNKYNELIDKLNKKISEPVYRDYKPLLDEEREALTEDQIEKWEEKAKSGVLRRDPLLSKVLGDMRLSLYTSVSGATVDPKFDTLSDIGITVGQPGSVYTYQENGKLYIDEDKLRTAIRDNGTKVMDLFTKTTTATTNPAKYNESGIAQRIYDNLNSVIDQITDVAGNSAMSDTSEYFSMGKSMRSLTKEIDRWEDRLKDIEDRYWRQFTAMEKAIAQANSQSGWLAQQFGGGQ